ACWSAWTPIATPALMVAPPWMTADVPGLAGVAASIAAIELWLGAALLTPEAAWPVPAFTRPALLFALAPLVCRLPMPWLPVTKLLPVCDCWPAFWFGSPLEFCTALAELPLLSE